MEEISEEEKAMYIYALHIVLYTNDLAINSIKELRGYVKGKDKESQKIFNALMKRVSEYEKKLYSDFHGNDVYFYADFNGFMDDYFDKDIEGLRRSAEWIFRCNGYEDFNYCSKVETIFSLSCLAISIANSYISGLRMNGARSFVLPDFRIDEIHRVASNFYDWSMSMANREKVLDLSKYKSIKRYFDRIKDSILSREIFSDAYMYALKEEMKRNEKSQD